MAEFLVRTENHAASQIGDEEISRLRAGERERAMELRAAGHLLRLWRVPGRNATVGLYAAADATELHDLLTSLPMWRYMDVHVEALAQHPQEPVTPAAPDDAGKA